MRNDLQHPVITRLRAYGYAYEYESAEPEIHYCCTCGRELLPADRGPFLDYPEECWECRRGKEEDDEEVAS